MRTRSAGALLLAVLCGLIASSHAFLPVLPINLTAVQCAAAVQSANATSTPAASAAVSLLYSLAASALSAPLHSITNTTLPLSNATLLPPNANPHYYYSLDPYWWPSDDCNRTAYPFPEYFEYCRYETRDGLVNPDTNRTTSPQQLRDLIHNVTVLSLASVAFGASDFGGASAADRAAQQLRAFFLDDATLMLPNVLYAQTQMGNNNGSVYGGRPEALLDMYELPLLLQAEQALYRSNASTLWAEQQHGQWLAWLAQYESNAVFGVQGQQVYALHNRHYSWLTCQLLALHAHAGNTTAAMQALHAYVSTDYNAQFNASGGQPNEAGAADWWANGVSNAEALDCIAAYSAMLDANHSLYAAPNVHNVTLYNITLALLTAAGVNGSLPASQQQRLLPLASHVLSVYGGGGDGRLAGFVAAAGGAAGAQVYELWTDAASRNCTLPPVEEASWAFYVQVIIIVGLTAIALAALAACVWRTRESGETGEEEGEEGAQAEEGEEQEEEEEEDDEDDGVRLTHSRDNSLVSVASGNDLNAVLLSEQYDDAVAAHNGHVRPANGRRKTRVSGVQQRPTV